MTDDSQVCDAWLHDNAGIGHRVATLDVTDLRGCPVLALRTPATVDRIVPVTQPIKMSDRLDKRQYCGRIIYSAMLGSQPVCVKITLLYETILTRCDTLQQLLSRTEHRCINECLWLHRLREDAHARVPRLLRVKMVRFADHRGVLALCVTMSRCGRTLHSWINELPGSDAQAVATANTLSRALEQVEETLCTLQLQYGFVHNDLHLDNVCLEPSSGEAWLIDLEYAEGFLKTGCYLGGSYDHAYPNAHTFEYDMFRLHADLVCSLCKSNTWRRIGDALRARLTTTLSACGYNIDEALYQCRDRHDTRNYRMYQRNVWQPHLCSAANPTIVESCVFRGTLDGHAALLWTHKRLMAAADVRSVKDAMEALGLDASQMRVAQTSVVGSVATACAEALLHALDDPQNAQDALTWCTAEGVYGAASHRHRFLRLVIVQSVLALYYRAVRASDNMHRWLMEETRDIHTLQVVNALTQREAHAHVRRLHELAVHCVDDVLLSRTHAYNTHERMKQSYGQFFEPSYCASWHPRLKRKDLNADVTQSGFGRCLPVPCLTVPGEDRNRISSRQTLCRLVAESVPVQTYEQQCCDDYYRFYMKIVHTT
ncbi:hypothetical protein CYMTET_2607 [Cymbomonas tetramitiformis]|uniref:Protein kinase domain-containing protein n=1 Tax=Cymbomonas tetramitiformis TaxID=36881 RepID=A0AAE0H4U2_9CHLO|nr:hypothetical protein CYMTET_2607 [Cymbomonas tetramitiformis]